MADGAASGSTNAACISMLIGEPFPRSVGRAPLTENVFPGVPLNGPKTLLPIEGTIRGSPNIDTLSNTYSADECVDVYGIVLANVHLPMSLSETRQTLEPGDDSTMSIATVSPGVTAQSLAWWAPSRHPDVIGVS